MITSVLPHTPAEGGTQGVGRSIKHGTLALPSAFVVSLLALIPGLADALRAGIDVLDSNCGRGQSLNLLARAFPKSRFVGYDRVGEAVAAGNAQARAWRLANIDFAVKEAAALTEPSHYDLVLAFEVLPDQAKLGAVLKRLAFALRPAGTFLTWDRMVFSDRRTNCSQPLGPYVSASCCTHCGTGAGRVNGGGPGTAWEEEHLRRVLTEAGFTRVAVHRLPQDLRATYYVATK